MVSIMVSLACVPAFNEGKNIAKLVKNCLNYVDKVVVYDDGSTDNTKFKAENAGAFVIRSEKNQGKGAALKSLFSISKFLNVDIMTTIDADGQFLPEEIPNLMEPISDKKFDIVIGNRFKSNNKIPKYRKFGNDFLDKITEFASDSNIEDTQSGFRSYSKKAIEKIHFNTKGFGADAEILLSAVKLGLTISEKPITVIYDTGGRTSTKNPISHTSEVIVSLIEEISLKRPLKFLGLPGIVLIGIGIIFLINTVSIFNDTRYFSVPNTMVSFSFLVIGIIMLLMSVLLYSVSRMNAKSQ
jgi:glycosyltransferase involved in cell wall biosynthesis